MYDVKLGIADVQPDAIILVARGLWCQLLALFFMRI